MTEDRKKEKGEVTRRDFLTGAGAAVVGAAVGAGIAYPLASDGGGSETVTTTKVVENTKTVEVPTTIVSTAPGGTVTETTTQTATTTKTVEVQAPGESSANMISLTVNGEEYQVQVEPQETLHEVVRNKIGFTSLKEMCTGYGACGSCSVIMDGRPVLSCMVLAIECSGKVLETAEGIAESKPELVEAYVENHCMQCGYCTPGFIVTAKALLDHNPNPTEEEIKEALGGNICRCATYPQHVKAVKQVSG
jgi:aerobic-type carbon monoxide dehydrogenase small subunit (CoxS/CutS family)